MSHEEISEGKSMEAGSTVVVIQNMQRMEYQGEPVITLRMMDELHQRPNGTARKAFNRHQGKLLEDVHFFRVSKNECALNGQSYKRGEGGEAPILLTEGGYLMLVKAFRDALAWQVQDALVQHYFRSKSSLVLPPKVPTGLEQIGEEVARGIQKGLAPFDKRLNSVETKVNEQGDMLREQGDLLRAVIRPAQPTAETKRQHIDTIAAYFGGRCPCCGEEEVVDRFHGKVKGAEWEHWFAPHRAGPNETWLTCRKCNILLKDHKYRSDHYTEFMAFQRRREQKYCPMFKPFNEVTT